MRAIRAIAVNTFREAIRDRILYLFVGFAVVMVVSTKLFGMLTVGDETKIMKDIGLAAMQFFSMLIAVMMSMLLISREVDSRTVFNILSKPVTRWQFIVGKYLGLVAIVAANLAFITVVLVTMVAVLLTGSDSRPRTSAKSIKKPLSPGSTVPTSQVSGPLPSPERGKPEVS